MFDVAGILKPRLGYVTDKIDISGCDTGVAYLNSRTKTVVGRKRLNSFTMPFILSEVAQRRK